MVPVFSKAFPVYEILIDEAINLAWLNCPGSPITNGGPAITPGVTGALNGFPLASFCPVSAEVAKTETGTAGSKV